MGWGISRQPISYFIIVSLFFAFNEVSISMTFEIPICFLSFKCVLLVHFSDFHICSYFGLIRYLAQADFFSFVFSLLEKGREGGVKTKQRSMYLHSMVNDQKLRD